MYAYLIDHKGIKNFWLWEYEPNFKSDNLIRSHKSLKYQTAVMLKRRLNMQVGSKPEPTSDLYEYREIWFTF